MKANSLAVYSELLAELDTLDKEPVEINGKQLKASQCYHIGVNPTHVLFNTNCPESLKEKVNTILARYRLINE
jgi:hypothetical protein